MKVWIENLENPLVLIGFVVFILAGVISLAFRKAKASNEQTAKGDNNVQIMGGRDVSINKEPTKK